MNKHGILISYRWIALGLFLLTVGVWSVSSTMAQPPIPHAVPDTIEVDCLSCHQAGVAGAPRLAWDHLGRTNEDCEQCHAISGNFAVDIPHESEGRTECYDCHLDGSGGAPRVAGNHASYAVDTCQMCHLQNPQAVVEEEEIEEEDTGPHILYGLEAGKTCLECHRNQFADDGHKEITELAQTEEFKQTQADFLFAAYCATCHGADGTTEVFPLALINAQKEELLAEMKREAAKKAQEEKKKAEEEAQAEEEPEEGDEAAEGDETASEAEVSETEVSEEGAETTEEEATEEEQAPEEPVAELTLDDIEVEGVPGTGIIINSLEYMSTHDDASLMRAIIYLPSNPEHSFGREYGGPLKHEDVVTLGEYMRQWGEMGPELDYPIPSFAEEVYPIIEKECGGQCHLEKQKGNWSMASYEDMMTTGDHAPNNIIPDDPDNSLLAQKLQNKQTIGEMMPTDRPIKQDQISLIVEWIRAGAPNN